jgi:glycerol-3-phosphate cytidylyltransferase
MTKIGFTCGAWDLFHAGHVHFLGECKKYCDWLIVGLQHDPSIDRPTTKNRPVQSLFERYLQLKGCRYCDQIIPYETEEDLNSLCATTTFDVRLLGDDAIETRMTGHEIMKENGTEIIYITRRHTFSSTNLRTRIIKQGGGVITGDG